MRPNVDSGGQLGRNIAVTQIPEEVLVFSWEVEDEGYRWVRAKDASRIGDPETEEDLYLVPADQRLGRTITRYSPLMAEHSLFRDFGATTPSQDGILAFATKRGLLGANARGAIVVNSRLTFGERAAVWFNEIMSMRHAVRLWDMVTSRDEAGLARHITWAEDASGVRYESHPGYVGGPVDKDDPFVEIRWIASRDDRAEAFASLEPYDVFRPALLQIQWMVNEHLQGRASPRLLWDRAWSNLALHLVPAGLVGALWLQFAQAIAGDRQFKACAECGRWYEVHPDATRVDRKYCSDACRVRAHRKRRATGKR